MATLSIDSRQLCMGAQRIETLHLDPRASHSLARSLIQKIFSSLGLSAPPDLDNLALCQNRLVYQVNGVEKSAALKESARKRVHRLFANAFSFARNTQESAGGGQVDWRPAGQALKQIDAAGAHGVRLPFQQALVPTFRGLNLVKNTLGLAIGRQIPYFAIGAAASGLNLGNGLLEWRAGLKEERRALEVGDPEGLCQAGAKMTQGKTQVAAATLYLAGRGVDLALKAPVGAMMVTFSLFFSALAAAIGSGVSIAGLARTDQFKKELDDYLKNPHLTEEQKVRGALKHLREHLTLSPAEKASRTPQEQAYLIETRVKGFERRCSLTGLLRFVTRADEVLSLLESPSTRALGVQEGRKLLSVICREANKKMAFHALALAAALLALGAVLSHLILGQSDTVTYLLGGSASLIWLSLAVYSLSVTAKNWKEIKDFNSQKLEKQTIIK